jgi:histidinol-phosphatase
MQSVVLDQIEECARRCLDHAARRAVEIADLGFASSRKPDSTWVTDADLTIERELRALIGASFPDHAILGEEQGGVATREGVVWILDPIDGTFSFVNRVPFYSSLLCVCVDGEPIIGMASLPALGWFMTGRKGQGSFLNGKRMHVNDLPQTRPSEIVGIADPYRFRMVGYGQVAEDLLADPFKTRVYPDGLGYALLLKGSIRCFVDPRTEIWDTAPFRVILPEAGFDLQHWDGSRGFSRGAVVSSAGDRGWAPDVLDLLRASGRQTVDEGVQERGVGFE